MPFSFIVPGRLRAVIGGLVPQIDALQEAKRLADEPRRQEFLKDLETIARIRDELFGAQDERSLKLLESYIQTTAKGFSGDP